MQAPISHREGLILLQVDVVDTVVPALLGLDFMHPLRILINTVNCTLVLGGGGERIPCSWINFHMYFTCRLNSRTNPGAADCIMFTEPELRKLH